MDKLKFQYEGIKWLYELEMLNHPQLINNLKLNVMVVSKSIKEVELLIYRENKSMLVLLDLGWFGKRFRRRQIFSEVEDMLSQMLPSFRFRVTDDPEIMKMAVERVKRALTGGNYENNNSSSDAKLGANASSTGIDESKAPAASQGSAQDQGSDSKEQSKVGEELLPKISSDDSGEKQ